MRDKTTGSVLLILLLFITHISLSEQFLNTVKDWLFGLREEEKLEPVSLRTSSFRFEITSGDEKFMQLKDALDEYQPLEACNHIVVYNLKKRCGELSEEELGKLSVQLLNCQSSAEERPVFRCTDSMTLADCTRSMDATTWNTYHIISNRARALCYATQQQQFKKITELTVGQLMSTAHQQLKTMNEMQNSQEQLHTITTETVRKLFESQTDLIGTQQNLKHAQDGILDQIHGNMQELVREKSLIATGNQELAQMTEVIREKLDKTTQKLQEQEESQMDTHKKIIEDLTSIQQKAQDALKKLDNSSQYLMRNHEELMTHYRAMYENMMKMNGTVTHLLNTVNTMQANLDERISWFTQLLSMADDKLTLLTAAGTHIMYFLLAALAAAFLQTPAFSRMMMMLILIVNAVSEIKYGEKIDFGTVTIFIVFTVLVNWIYLWWIGRYFNRGTQYRAPKAIGYSAETTNLEDNSDIAAANVNNSKEPLSPFELQRLTGLVERLCTSLNEVISKRPDTASNLSDPNSNSRLDTPSTSSAFQSVRREEPVRPDSSTMDEGANLRRLLLQRHFDNDSSFAGSSRSSTPRAPSKTSSRGSTSSAGCQGFTKSGTPCRLTASSGDDFCHRHRATR
ncbi:hypothetical protein ACJMK2_008448 [Sinanodonta woodiana]|uniref:Protein brambleberry n=1 Tax=Sinanodonta woodiana TaxID=1069815 RepID=A0ABD3VLN3_SINWO